LTPTLTSSTNRWATCAASIATSDDIPQEPQQGKHSTIYNVVGALLPSQPTTRMTQRKAAYLDELNDLMGQPPPQEPAMSPGKRRSPAGAVAVQHSADHDVAGAAHRQAGVRLWRRRRGPARGPLAGQQDGQWLGGRPRGTFWHDRAGASSASRAAMRTSSLAVV
jgi:hypothetical protein